MPRFHHSNLGIPLDGLPAQAAFLVDILGYRRIDAGRFAAMGANWFEADDGTQIHLSLDPDHRPAAMAHLAVDFGDDLGAVEGRLRDAGCEVSSTDAGDGLQIVNCLDPAGNRWELRGRSLSTR
jgi:hypothetical protein